MITQLAMPVHRVLKIFNIFTVSELDCCESSLTALQLIERKWMVQPHLVMKKEYEAFDKLLQMYKL